MQLFDRLFILVCNVLLSEHNILKIIIYLEPFSTVLKGTSKTTTNVAGCFKFAEVPSLPTEGAD